MQLAIHSLLVNVQDRGGGGMSHSLNCLIFSIADQEM